MKITFFISPKWQVALLCFVLLPSGTCIAQSTTSNVMDSNVLYYILGGAILVVFIATIFVIQKAANAFGQYGGSIFDLDFPIFKRMTESSGIVAIIMILLVLWGIYSVVTYKAT